MRIEGTKENRGTLGIFTGLFVLGVAGICLEFWITESAAIKLERSSAERSSGTSRNKVELLSSPFHVDSADSRFRFRYSLPTAFGETQDFQSLTTMDPEVRSEWLDSQSVKKVSNRHFKKVENPDGTVDYVRDGIVLETKSDATK